MSFLLSPQLLAAALITGGLYACVALELNLIYGTMRLLNVAHGEIVMIGAYVMYWLVMLTPVGPLPALLLAAGLCGLLGLALYHGLFRAVLSSPRMVERIEGEFAAAVLRSVRRAAERHEARVYRELARAPAVSRFV